MERRPGYVGPLLLLSIGFIYCSITWILPWRYGTALALLVSDIDIIRHRNPCRHAESNLMYMIAIFLSVC